MKIENLIQRYAQDIRLKASDHIDLHKLQGVEAQDLENKIRLNIARKQPAFEQAIAAGDRDQEKELLKKAVNSAQNWATATSRKHLRKLIPSQVRHCRGNQKAVDRTRQAIASDMSAGTHHWEAVHARVRLIRHILTHHLASEYREMALDYMRLGSWKRVAKARGISSTTFHRNVLPALTAAFKAAWHLHR